jgi:uncharacterized membrane-anchored protein YitT (DUF2179 family)
MQPHEEQITERKEKKKVGWGFFILGIIISIIGYVVYDFHINHYVVTQTGKKVLLRSEYPFQSIGLLVAIAGIIIISIVLIRKVISRV